MKLTLDEKDDLLNLMQSSGWDVLVKLVQHLEQKQKDRVMAYSLEKGPDGLVIEKARAEGAMRIVRGLVEHRNKEVRGANA